MACSAGLSHRRYWPRDYWLAATGNGYGTLIVVLPLAVWPVDVRAVTRTVLLPGEEYVWLVEGPDVVC